MNSIKNLLILVCAGGVIFLAMLFFSRPAPIEVSMVGVTEEMLKASEGKMKEEENKQKATQAARARVELEKKVGKCETSDQCIIVDSDPCGCARGPKGVRAINSDFSLEYSRLMERKYTKIEVCPEKNSVEKECSPSAHAVCEANLCKIVY